MQETDIPENKIKSMTRNFALKNIAASYFPTLNDAADEILGAIPRHASVGIGHSATLQAMNITQRLMGRGNDVYDKELAESQEEARLLKRKSLLTDWYLTGANAISADGHIVFIDHSGNRAGAVTYGPDHVIVVAGINKIVDTLDEAVKRARNIAAPLNARRGGYDTPCVKLNKCVDCTSKERICNYLLVVEGQPEESRMKLFIVQENIGF